MSKRVGVLAETLAKEAGINEQYVYVLANYLVNGILKSFENGELIQK